MLACNNMMGLVCNLVVMWQQVVCLQRIKNSLAISVLTPLIALFLTQLTGLQQHDAISCIGLFVQSVVLHLKGIFRIQ